MNFYNLFLFPEGRKKKTQFLQCYQADRKEMLAGRDNVIRDKGELHTLYGLQDIKSIFSNLLTVSWASNIRDTESSFKNHGVMLSEIAKTCYITFCC